MSDDHRQAAADWHGGQSSPLYAYASTGTVVTGIGGEIKDCLAIVERGELAAGVDAVEEHERLLALLHHVEPQLAMTKAREIGRHHGEAVVRRWQQETLGGRATGDAAETARRVLQGIEDGDPAILNGLPGTVQNYLSVDLEGDCDWTEPNPDDRAAHARWDAARHKIWDAYETAFPGFRPRVSFGGGVQSTCLPNPAGSGFPKA